MTKAELRPEIITKNSTIEPDKFSCISFENIGESSVKILSEITLDPGDKKEFKFDPGIVITNKIPVVFQGTTSPSLLIIKTYFNEVKELGPKQH